MIKISRTRHFAQGGTRCNTGLLWECYALEFMQELWTMSRRGRGRGRGGGRKWHFVKNNSVKFLPVCAVIWTLLRMEFKFLSPSKLCCCTRGYLLHQEQVMLISKTTETLLLHVRIAQVVERSYDCSFFTTLYKDETAGKQCGTAMFHYAFFLVLETIYL